MAFMDDFKSAASSVAGTVKNVADSLNSLSNPSTILSKIRSMNVPTGKGGAFSATRVSFGGPGNNEDWRVRLSLPPNFFQSSPVLKPLVDAGGLVFPYTPAITISHSAQYSEEAVIHQNYQFIAYQNSRMDAITITGMFAAEDYVQAQYWIAALHFLRSATKMYTGDSEYAGSPPPILYLNGYGNYVFQNVPVVIKSFNIELPQDVNYIATDMGAPAYNPVASSGVGPSGGGSLLGSTSKTLMGVAGLAGAVGSAKLAKSLGAAGAIAGATAGIGSLLSKVSATGEKSPSGSGASYTTNAGVTHVPVKSNVSVTVQPIYSREAVRQFSLKTFVEGGYVKGTGGYI